MGIWHLYPVQLVLATGSPFSLCCTKLPHSFFLLTALRGLEQQSYGLKCSKSFQLFCFRNEILLISIISMSSVFNYPVYELSFVDNLGPPLLYFKRLQDVFFRSIMTWLHCASQLLVGQPYPVWGLWEEEKVPGGCSGQQAEAGGSGGTTAAGEEGHQLYLRPYLRCLLHPARGDESLLSVANVANVANVVTALIITVAVMEL